MEHTILIVDDEPFITEILTEALSRGPYVILAAGSAEDALGLLAQIQVDVIISDEKMPGMSGSEFLAVVRKKYPDTIRMILTGHGSLESAMRAINEGEIYRFFTKPCNVLDLAMTIRRAIQHNDLKKAVQRLLSMEKQQSAFIKNLEKKYPGITKVNRDSRGEIIIDDAIDNRRWDTLIEEISRAVKGRQAILGSRA
ncbi:MAG: response regulator [Deltaproteobacteria bacterium]|nr:response regulator [Deltaproteobacteria bacterium]MBW2338838.1 response regulator [Deltaproteobacteria bacterium]